MRITKTHIGLASLMLALFIAYWTIQTTEASIDYWMENQKSFPKGLNSITIYCKNGGESDGNFKLKLEFINASFSNQTEMPYSQIDESTVDVTFLLHKSESNQKKIYFTIPDNTTSFSIKLDCDKITLFMKSNPMFPNELMFWWENEINAFNRYTEV